MLFRRRVHKNSSELWFKGDVGLNYLFFQVANVAQIKPDHFNDCEEDHPGYEQSLVVPGKIIELEIKQEGMKTSLLLAVHRTI